MAGKKYIEFSSCSSSSSTLYDEPAGLWPEMQYNPLPPWEAMAKPTGEWLADSEGIKAYAVGCLRG